MSGYGELDILWSVSNSREQCVTINASMHNEFDSMFSGSNQGVSISSRHIVHIYRGIYFDLKIYNEKINQCNFASSWASALGKHLKKHTAGYLGQIKACIFLMIRPKSSACHTTGCHYFIHPVLTACNLSQI